MNSLQHILDEIGAEMATMQARGRVADYIPELARIDPGKFGMAVALPDGTVLKTGDADEGFSIQSISKAFTLGIALGRLGDQLWSRVGREPSGQRFNSIVQLELEKGRPRNPFINAGAISVTDAILEGRAPSTLLCEIVDFIKHAADDESIFINESVAKSEKQTGHRNYALAHFMRDHGVLRHDPDLTLGAYFHQCAVEMSCVQLARAGLFLTSTGSTTPVIAPHHVRRICAIMMTCGHYDASGEFAFQVGLPGKSGVGGGILVIAPGRASIAIWSPGLNENGNSKLGSLAARRLAQKTGWSVFSGQHLAD